MLEGSRIGGLLDAKGALDIIILYNTLISEKSRLICAKDEVGRCLWRTLFLDGVEVLI
jgi:hypothetical protein